MATSVWVSVNAEPSDLRATYQSFAGVVLSAGPVTLFVGGSKADTLAGLARWVELVEALPDDEDS